MNRALRTTALTACVSLLMTGTALAGKSGKRVIRDKACTMVTTRQVEKAFGGPVAEGVENAVVLACTYIVGEDRTQAPGGEFATQQLFPSILNTTDTAKEAIEDARSIDVLAEHDLEDVDGVGRYAYYDATDGRIMVQATKKFAFVLNWTTPAPATPQPGQPEGRLSKKHKKALIRLAKDVVKRAPK